MYAREDTVNWLLAKRANTGILGGPLKQTCIHLASARRSGQASQVSRSRGGDIISDAVKKLF